jgi:hypothetical protein
MSYPSILQACFKKNDSKLIVKNKNTFCYSWLHVSSCRIHVLKQISRLSLWLQWSSYSHGFLSGSSYYFRHMLMRTFVFSQMNYRSISFTNNHQEFVTKIHKAVEEFPRSINGQKILIIYFTVEQTQNTILKYTLNLK